MKIQGLQELTLIDYPGKIACTIFLFGCNFKCGFCHNPELVLNPVGKSYTKKEILEFLEKRKGQLEGVCITGGEPLLTLEVDFLKKIKELGYEIKLDTNGSFPELLKELIKNKLIDYVAMDIKSSRAKYSEITDSDVEIKDIEKSIKILSSLLDYYEFRTTILEDFHNLKEMQEISKWLNELCSKKPKKLVLQGFKNQGKFIDEKFKKVKNVEENSLKELKKGVEDFFEEVEIRV